MPKLEVIPSEDRKRETFKEFLCDNRRPLTFSELTKTLNASEVLWAIYDTINLDIFELKL